jgi:hypothetical protein
VGRSDADGLADALEAVLADWQRYSSRCLSAVEELSWSNVTSTFLEQAGYSARRRSA